MLVPRSFVVPIGDDRGLKMAWGYSLDYEVGLIRHRLEADEGHKLPTSLVREQKKLDFAQNAIQSS
ncbi:hypothetical protein PC116_g22205 [Phytophthora cactorum]|nr:hypothetical protein PC116_g22205 [Phytophthora cactorum]